MKTFIAFAAIVTCAFASPLIQNGELEKVIPHSKNAAFLSDRGGLVPMEKPQRSIVGGVVTTIEQFPWVVSMQHQGAHRCGGSIISTTRILSVAQCTVDVTAGALSIRAGSTYHNAGGQLVGVSAIINHPQYNRETLNYNICVLNLESALNADSAGVAIIGRPPQGAGTADGVTATLPGWGATVEADPPSLSVNAVFQTVISNAVCNQYDFVFIKITDQMLCAGVPVSPGPEICHGGTGGPLIVGGQLVGILHHNFRCARPGAPDIYTRTSSFTNWINELLQTYFLVQINGLNFKI